MRTPVPANQLRPDLDHIAKSLARVHDPVKRYLITLLVDAIADHCEKDDPAAKSGRRSHDDDRSRSKPH